MIASVISNLCHIGMAPLPGAFVMARHFAFVLPWTYEAARGEPCSGARPEAGMANATGCDRRSAASRRLHHRLAADEACELAQPHEHALPGKLLEAVIEAQQQSAALDHHRRLRQHAGGRGGNEVGDAQRYDAFNRTLDASADVLRELVLQPPPNLTNRTKLAALREALRAGRIGNRLRRLSAENLRTLLELLTKSAADYLDAWFGGELVKARLGFDAIVGNYASPYTPGTAYVLLHHAFGEVNGKR